MNEMHPDHPVVLVFAGHDPSGGAGVQADIETIASLRCHAATVITALTVQDTRDVSGFMPVEPTLIVEQARAVLEDMPVAVIKIGMLGSVENAEVIHTVLADYPEIPVVYDPVLASGGGAALAGDGLREAVKTLLLPLTHVLTPNTVEARALAPEADTLNACALALLDQGVDYVLITGTHEPEPQVVNRLYHAGIRAGTFHWTRLPDSYHGSGCTLASAIAGFLARRQETGDAIRNAQAYTWNALRQGFRPGLGQLLPLRFQPPPEDH